MDYRKYSKKLEEIISAINMPESTRILVDALVERSRKECSNGD